MALDTIQLVRKHRKGREGSSAATRTAGGGGRGLRIDFFAYVLIERRLKKKSSFIEILIGLSASEDDVNPYSH